MDRMTDVTMRDDRIWVTRMLKDARVGDYIRKQIDENFHTSAIADDQIRAAKWVLGTISPDQRHALLGRYKDRCTYKKLSEDLKKSDSTIHTIIHTGLQRLQNPLRTKIIFDGYKEDADEEPVMKSILQAYKDYDLSATDITITHLYLEGYMDKRVYNALRCYRSNEMTLQAVIQLTTGGKKWIPYVDGAGSRCEYLIYELLRDFGKHPEQIVEDLKATAKIDYSRFQSKANVIGVYALYIANLISKDVEDALEVTGVRTLDTILKLVDSKNTDGAYYDSFMTRLASHFGAEMHDKVEGQIVQCVNKLTK